MKTRGRSAGKQSLLCCRLRVERIKTDLESKRNTEEFPPWYGFNGLSQWAKDLGLLQVWRRSQLQLGFDPWPGNFHMLWVQP